MKPVLKPISIILISLIFVVAGVLHFLIPKTYMKIMPPQLPLHREAVYISGVFEILGGIGILIPRFRKRAGYGLIALLIGVFPANVYMASSEDIVPEVPNWMAIARLPLQFVLIAWIYWAVIADTEQDIV